MERNKAIFEGSRARFRPVMITATVAALGLAPFLFATGPGAEVQRPLTIVVIGGLISSTLLTLRRSQGGRGRIATSCRTGYIRSLHNWLT